MTTDEFDAWWSADGHAFTFSRLEGMIRRRCRLSPELAHAEAEEALVDVYLRCVKYLSGYNPDRGRIEAWVTRKAWQAFANSKQAESRVKRGGGMTRDVDFDIEAVAAPVEGDEVRERHLTPLYKSILLETFRGKSAKEIGQARKRSARTIQWELGQAYKALGLSREGGFVVLLAMRECFKRRIFTYQEVFERI